MDGSMSRTHYEARRNGAGRTELGLAHNRSVHIRAGADGPPERSVEGAAAEAGVMKDTTATCSLQIQLDLTQDRASRRVLNASPRCAEAAERIRGAHRNLHPRRLTTSTPCESTIVT